MEKIESKKNYNEEGIRPYIWFGIIGSFLAAINNVTATLALGVFQGPVVAFTTPFAFCLAKLLFPRKMGASLIFLPLIIVSIFTLNFGPPGYYKIVFTIGAILYDLCCFIFRVGREKKRVIPSWKLITATIFYPIGLLLGGLVAINYIVVDIEIPILSQGLKGAVLMVLLFAIIGGISTFICHRIFYRFIRREIEVGNLK